MKTLFKKALHSTYLRSQKTAYQNLIESTHTASAQQLKSLLARVHKNANTQFGKSHAFNRIASLNDFQNAVPIQSYESLSPWIQKVANGEPRVLTESPTILFERTSGSTSQNKIIPFTQDFLAEVKQAVNAWLWSLYTHYPDMIGTSSYWSLSPVLRAPEKTPSGIPIGMQNDTEYMDPIAAYFLGLFQAVPASLIHEQDYTLWLQSTCRHLIECEDLGFISVWSPTFLLRLLEEIESNQSFYYERIARRSKKRFMDAFNKPCWADALWPKLQVVSCWTDGTAKVYAQSLNKYFKRTIIQGKGLFATEAMVSIPLVGVEGSALCLTSHFYEFMDIENPSEKPLMAHQLTKGKAYSPIITTGSGLYRYHLKDILHCTGFLNQTPTFTFVSKLEVVSDLCGEKLSALQVQEALGAISDQNFWAWSLLVPETKTRRYILYVESTAEFNEQLYSEKIDLLLQRNVHYSYARKIEQLAPLKIVKIPNGKNIWTKTLLENGMRLGDIKPTYLDLREHWHETFRNHQTVFN